MSRVASRLFGWTAVLLVSFAFLTVIGFRMPGLDFAFFLAAGWVWYASRIIPQVRVRPELLLSTLAYATGFVVGAHLFLRWLYRESGVGPRGDLTARVWRWRWTLSGFAMIVLMFVVGMATIGVAHQAAWLARSPEPLYTRDRASRRISCGINLRQIGQACLRYADEHDGTFPDDLATLLRQGDEVSPHWLICPGTDATPASAQSPDAVAAQIRRPEHCSYVYLGRSLRRPIDPKRVVAVEPIENHAGRGMNVLYADGAVEWLERPRADAVLDALGFERIEPEPADAR